MLTSRAAAAHPHRVPFQQGRAFYGRTSVLLKFFSRVLLSPHFSTLGAFIWRIKGVVGNIFLPGACPASGASSLCLVVPQCRMSSDALLQEAALSG